MRRHATIALAAACALLCAACGLPRWPAAGRLTSPYGLRFQGIVPEVHQGVDISMPPGTPVHAMTAGRVSFAGTMGAYGLVVIVDHGGTTESVYAHLSELHVREGDRVARDQPIALSGQSGNASGPHLHFEVRRWGRALDPVPLLGRLPPAD